MLLFYGNDHRPDPKRLQSHDPISFDWKDNSDSKDNILFPYGKPKLSEQQLKYASVKPW